MVGSSVQQDDMTRGTFSVDETMKTNENKTSPPEILSKYHHHVFLQFSVSIRDLANLGVSYLEKSVGDRCHDMFRFLLFYSSPLQMVFPLPMKQKKRQPQKIHCASQMALLQLV